MVKCYLGELNGVGIATDYGLNVGGVGVRVPVGQEFSLLHVVQNDSGAHPAIYPMRAGGSFPWGKREADRSPTT
jgi:hypothetical protein